MNKDRIKMLLEEAIDRIKDLRMEDDGFADKEARKFLERVEKERQKPLGLSEWRTMESAPKTGERILVIRISRSIEKAQWYTPENMEKPQPYWAGLPSRGLYYDINSTPLLWRPCLEVPISTSDWDEFAANLIR